MEYAADDFEIALLAKGLGDTADYDKYLERSGNWKNLWDPASAMAALRASSARATATGAGLRLSRP